MKIRLLTASILALMAVSTANAADVTPTYEDVWTGFYIGAHGGYRMGSVSFDHYEIAGAGFYDTRETFSVDPSGFGGGGQIGFNYQINSIVLGIEGTYTAGDITDSDETDLDSGGNFGPTPREREAEIGAMWTVGARLGYALDNSLFYGKAGYASTSLSFDNICAESKGFCAGFDGESLGNSDDTVGGFFVGAGYEYKLMEHLGLGIDYTYAGFSPDDQPVSDCCGNDDIDMDVQQIMFRLNFHM